MARSETQLVVGVVGIENHGSLVLVRPLTSSVAAWLEEHTNGTWFGGALVVEPRYLDNLLDGLLRDVDVLVQTPDDASVRPEGE